MSSPEAPSTALAPAFVQALRRALRPLVWLMLSRGVTFPFLSELLKALMVEVADKNFRIADRAPTDSRISLMTGVHRKDVSRLRQAIESRAEHMPSAVSLGSQLAALWLGSPKYLDDEGRPRPLPRFASEGGELSFEALVAGVNSDIRSRVVLDEWLRLGVARIDENKRVRLNAEAFVPAEGLEEKAFYFGHNLHDHASAAASNLLGGSAPFLERSVHYNELSAASVKALAKQSEAAGMKALLAINKSALAAEQADAASGSDHAPRQRMTFGIYFFTEAAQAEQSAQSTPPDRPSAPAAPSARPDPAKETPR